MSAPGGDSILPLWNDLKTKNTRQGLDKLGLGLVKKSKTHVHERVRRELCAWACPTHGHTIGQSDHLHYSNAWSSPSHTKNVEMD